jgi:hypothetical protein
VLAFVFWRQPTQAFRPFDGSDAAVADLHQIEIELGPVEYLRDAAQRTLFVPLDGAQLRICPGVGRRGQNALSGGVPGAGLVDAGAFLKSVLREGMLQDRAGPSIATDSAFSSPVSATIAASVRASPASSRSDGTGRRCMSMPPPR